MPCAAPWTSSGSLNGCRPTLNSSGTADVDAAVTGSAQRWQPAGSATIRDGQFQWQPVPLRLENIAGRLLLADGVIRADQLGANAGKGTVKIEGSLPLRLLSSALPAPSVDEGQPARFSAQVDGLKISAGKGEKEATGILRFETDGRSVVPLARRHPGRG